ncbi:30S ribosomal protein S9, partial [Candidatus Dojkabacteria bacterium]|nr:30S ribosomal protein S9 [Candidatus Dojkabacteria bacterium]
NYALGRRKTSTATVRLYEGKGDSTVNGKPLAEIYPSKIDKAIIHSPLKTIDKIGEFYFTVRTAGGGIKGQRDAIVHGLARALVDYDEAFKQPLKKEGFLTRDPRMVERKHTGFRKARKSEQYSKR